METTITRNRTTYQILSDAWYTSHPVQVGDRLEIARCHAKDGRRYPTPEEQEAHDVSRYASSHEFTGREVELFLGLTAEELAAYGFQPTGKNPTGRRVSSPAEAQAVVDALCNEGY